MQQKFKIGDKVKVLTKAYPGAYGTEGVITKFGHGSVYMVERNAANYPSDQYGCFDHDSWRYCFYERELELVEDKPKTKFKAGDKVVCVRGNEYHNASPFQGDHYLVTNAYIKDGCEYVDFHEYKGSWDADRFELIEDKPKFKVGDKVRCAKGVKCKLQGVDEFTVRGVNGPMILLIVEGKIAYEEARLFELVTDQEVSNTEPNVQITVNIDENICAAFNEVKNGLEILLSGKSEPDYVIGQEVYVSNDFNRYLRKGVLLDAVVRNGLMHVNIGGFDCFVEEERVYTKEMKGD